MFPVEKVIDEIRGHLAANRDVVLTAPPGSGKTTCVPLSLMDEPWLEGRKILMLEPRRIAARNCARYIAAKRGESVGESLIGGACGQVEFRCFLDARLCGATDSNGADDAYRHHQNEPCKAI